MATGSRYTVASASNVLSVRSVVPYISEKEASIYLYLGERCGQTLISRPDGKPNRTLLYNRPQSRHFERSNFRERLLSALEESVRHPYARSISRSKRSCNAVMCAQKAPPLGYEFVHGCSRYRVNVSQDVQR